MHLYEMLKNEKVDCNSEVRRIDTLLSCEDLSCGYRNYSLNQIINSVFKKLKVRGTYLSIEELRQALNLDISVGRRVYTLEEFLLLSELVFTIFWQAHAYLDDLYTGRRKEDIIGRMEEIQNNINYVLEKLNYEAYLKDEFVFIAPKDMVVDEAIECVDDENIALELLHYNHRQLLGDLQGKRKILTQLGSYLEPVLNSKQLSSNGYRSLESDIGFYLNNLNIRHNNLEGAKRQSCCVEIHQKDELEVWYDKAYRAMVMAIISKIQIDNHNQLEQLKRSNGM